MVWSDKPILSASSCWVMEFAFMNPRMQFLTSSCEISGIVFKNKHKFGSFYKKSTKFVVGDNMIMFETKIIIIAELTTQSEARR